MRKIPLKTIKMLFASSGGICALSDCTTTIIDPKSGTLLGQMCHINAASEGGPRYDPTLPYAERNDSNNLIILCPTHHSLIDQDTVTYTAEVLRKIKYRHESQVAATVQALTQSISVKQTTDFARRVDDESVDFAIVVALPREFEALKTYFPELRQLRNNALIPRSYYTATITTKGGGSYRVVATLLHSMGNLEAAHATSDLIRDWNPRFILVNGIAGGFRQGEQELGDIVVSDSIVYYELGKLCEAGMEHRNKQFPADSNLLDGMLNLTIKDWRMRLPKRPDDKRPTNAIPRIHIGPIASGEKVIAVSEEADRLREIQRNLIAVEMESAGVASAAFSALKQIGFITVRSICDFADASKNDSWHEYAACSAASCLRALLDNRPVALSEGKWPTMTAPPLKKKVTAEMRRQLYDQLCSAVDMEEFKNFCFLIGVDIDELPGDRKSTRVRELILLFERKGRFEFLTSAVHDLIINNEA